MEKGDYSFFQSWLGRIRIFLHFIFPLSNACIQLIKPKCILSNKTKFSVPFPHPFLSQIPAQENHSKFFAISPDIFPSYPLYCLFRVSCFRCYSLDFYYCIWGLSSHILNPFTWVPLSYCHILVTSIFSVYNIMTRYVPPQQSQILYSETFCFPVVCLCCFVCLLCWFFLCILSLIQMQTCRANHRTPLSYNCTYEEISQLHCSLLEASFLETPTLSLVLSAPAWPGPVGHSRRAVFLGLALSFPGFGSLGLHFPSFLMSPLTLPCQCIVSSPS